MPRWRWGACSGKRRLRGEAADADSLGSAPAGGGRSQVQGGDADGQPGLLARSAPDGLRNRLVGRDRQRHRSACGDRRAPSWPQGMQTIPPDEPVSAAGLDWDLWLGGAAMRPYTSGGWDKEHAPDRPSSSGRLLSAVQLAGILRFRHGFAGRLGHPHPGSGESGAAIGHADCRGMHPRGTKSTFTYPLRSVLRYDFPARGNMPPVSVYWYDGVHGASCRICIARRAWKTKSCCRG